MAILQTLGYFFCVLKRLLVSYPRIQYSSGRHSDLSLLNYICFFWRIGTIILCWQNAKGKVAPNCNNMPINFRQHSFSLTSQQSKQSGAIDNIKNNSNFSLIATVNHLNLSKGYAPYWDGNINTYLSKGSVHFLPIICSADRTIFMNYLVDASQYKTPVARSFYLVDSDLKFPPTCSDTAILKQFGDPAKVVKVGNITILIYDYDLGKRM